MYNNINMKKVVIWLFGIMIVSFLIAGSIMKFDGFKGAMFRSPEKITQGDINIVELFNAADIKDIDANTVSTDISVIPVDSNEVKVHFYGYSRGGSSNSAPELIAEMRGNKLDIEVRHKFNINFGFNFHNEKLKLDVYVPRSYAGNIKLGTVSGDLDISGFNLEKLDCESVSGELKISSVNTRECALNTTSGDGSARDFSGRLEFHSVSGGFNAELNKLIGDVKVSTTSGGGKLRIPEDSDFNVNFSSVSGKFDSSFTLGTKGSQSKRNFHGTAGDGTYNINFSSTSGDFEITK